MAFNINNFLANGLVYGGARPALFDLTFTPPSALGIVSTASQKVNYTCKGASLPNAKLGNVDVGYFGRKIKVAGDRVFDDWRISVMNDEDFQARALFESWSNGINSLVGNVRNNALEGPTTISGIGGSTPSEPYKVDIQINQYSKDGSIIRAYTMVGAWPVEVGAITLNWDTTNQVEEFDVTLAYDYWVPAVETSGKGGDSPYIADTGYTNVTNSTTNPSSGPQ